jgi:hypothetical protein
MGKIYKFPTGEVVESIDNRDVLKGLSDQLGKIEIQLRELGVEAVANDIHRAINKVAGAILAIDLERYKARKNEAV